MKKTDIITAHNVVIQYNIAPLSLRIIASILDMTMVGLYITLVTVLFASSMRSGIDDSDNPVMLIMYLFMLPGFFYSFLFETLLGGQTLGKMALGIRVLHINGKNASIGDLFLRWVFRFPDLLMSVGALGIITSLSNHRGQRLGDIVANTIIIKLKPDTGFSITDILNIKNSKEYIPTYPNVISFGDEDMLLIKNAMERLKKNPNKPHKKLVRELADLTASKLGLEETPKKKLSFLKTALQDYIVLTRS